MSLLNKIKQGVANSGSSMSKIVYTKDGSKVRVRFLQEVEDGIEVKLHDHYDQGINALCQKNLGKKCPYCKKESGDGWRHRDGYVWSVWDYDAKEVKLFLGFANNFSHLPALIGMAEAYGTLVDRDYILAQTGKQLSKQVSVVPMDKVKFKNPKAKALSEKKVLDLLSKAYPFKKEEKPEEEDYDNEEEMEDDDDDAEEEEAENEYDEMSPRELYMECVERGLKVKKKMKSKYYIKLLEEDDAKKDDDWDEEDDDDEEGEW